METLINKIKTNWKQKPLLNKIGVLLISVGLIIIIEDFGSQIYRTYNKALKAEEDRKEKILAYKNKKKREAKQLENFEKYLKSPTKNIDKAFMKNYAYYKRTAMRPVAFNNTDSRKNKYNALIYNNTKRLEKINKLLDEKASHLGIRNIHRHWNWITDYEKFDGIAVRSNIICTSIKHPELPSDIIKMKHGTEEDLYLFKVLETTYNYFEKGKLCTIF